VVNSNHAAEAVWPQLATQVFVGAVTRLCQCESYGVEIGTTG